MIKEIINRQDGSVEERAKGIRSKIWSLDMKNTWGGGNYSAKILSLKDQKCDGAFSENENIRSTTTLRKRYVCFRSVECR